MTSDDNNEALMNNTVAEAQITVEEFFLSVASTLGGNFRIFNDGFFHWLTPFSETEQKRYSQQAEYALARVGQTIPGLVTTPPPGGWPAILFSTTEEQLRYEQLFDNGDSENKPQMLNGGVWRSWPVGHLAIPANNWDAVDAAFGHELVHATLSGTGVPGWFQEGLATELETAMGNRTSPIHDLYHWKETLSWWRSHGSDLFWSGEAFSDAASSRHAYALAQVMAMRFIHKPENLRRACTIGYQAWQDQDGTLLSIYGIEREKLFQSIIGEGRRKGWLERFLFWCFVGERP
jgi:hypothetical protein